MSDPQPTITPQTVPTPVFDTSKITEDVTSKVNETVESKIAEATEKAAEAAAEKATANIAEKLVGKPQEAYQPKSWDQVRQDAAADALKTVEQRDKEREEAAKKAEDDKAKQTVAQEQEQYAQWDKQLKTLEESQVLPSHPQEIQEKLSRGEKLAGDDLNLPSVALRRKLFELAKAHPEDGNNLELVAYKHRDELLDNEQLPGANAPVFGAPKANSGASKSGYTWEQLHSTPAEEL